MRAGGIEEIVEPTLGLFVEESAGLAETLEESLAVGDAESVRRAAHTLKGSSGNVHARDLSRLAERLEAAAAQGDLETARQVMTDVRREYGSVVAFLKQSMQ